jgi:hypothetical protein
MKYEKFLMLQELYNRLQKDEQRRETISSIARRAHPYDNFLIIASRKDNEDKKEIVISDEVFHAILTELSNYLYQKVQTLQEEITQAL